VTSSHGLIRGLPCFFCRLPRRLRDPLGVSHGSHLQSETKVPPSSTRLAEPFCMVAEVKVSPGPASDFSALATGSLSGRGFCRSLCPSVGWGTQIHPTFLKSVGFLCFPKPLHSLSAHSHLTSFLSSSVQFGLSFLLQYEEGRQRSLSHAGPCTSRDESPQRL
jgi:hypothetical protein